MRIPNPIFLALTMGLSPIANGALSVSYDPTASNPTGGIYAYNATDGAGNPITIQMQTTLWDDSASSFSTANITPNGAFLGGPLTQTIDPGDFLCTEISYFDGNSGAPIVFTTVPGGSQLAGSIRLDGPNTYDDDLAFIFSPDTTPVNDFFVGGGVGVNVSQSNSPNFFNTPLGSGFGAIDALAANPDSTTYLFPGVTADQKAALVDFPNSTPNAFTTGFTWYAANTGTESIADAAFFFTVDGRLDRIVPIPEPSRSLLIGCSLFALLLRRRRR